MDGKSTRKKIGKRDQFAPELLYFSDCILKDRSPEPSGEEGLQDVRIVQALYESSRTRKTSQDPAVHEAPASHPSSANHTSGYSKTSSDQGSECKPGLN